MIMTQNKKTYSVNTDIPSESKQVQEKTPLFIKDDNFYILPFFDKYDPCFCERKTIQEIDKKYYISLQWSSVGTSVFCQKYNEMRPYHKLMFSIGIHSATRPGDFGYKRYRQQNDWYLGGMYIVSFDFIEFKVDELKLIISKIRSEMIGRDISQNFQNNYDLYFGDTLDELIQNIDIRMNMIVDALKSAISIKTGKQKESVSIDFNYGSVLDTMRKVDSM